MRARRRTDAEHQACMLPTRSIRITYRGETVDVWQWGSGRASQVLLTWPTEEEWDRMIREREAVEV